ncbi:hypothetical protein [Bradyrhizobium icense]|uniref:Uncharacterized protein n=1 Tax=Bradyrhizobium icense TaxID=1274631 RepID=A0A1B1UT19_9BRAD|nr:hypothetical protein [Bradyrhizobium icense]ANW05857.1 hypothetical protein LMTR13_25430 [Bradyrhizobium icense]
MPGNGYRQARPQQMDRFEGGLSNGAIDAPAWPELPAEARAALTTLMTQLILDHAATTAISPAKEVDHNL